MTHNDKISALRQYARENGGVLRKVPYRTFNDQSVYAVYVDGTRVSTVDTVAHLYNRMECGNLID